VIFLVETDNKKSVYYQQYRPVSDPLMQNMNKRNRNYVVFFLLIITSAVGITACTDSSPEYTFITENDVLEIIEAVETATQEKDIDNIIKRMSSSVEINISLDTIFGPQKQRWSREQYQKETEKGWAMASSYEYKRENDKVKISDDGQSAVVEADIIETMVVQGNRMRSTTHEKVTIEIIDGQLLVTHLDAVVRM
jgi:hypothetical protein